MQDEVEKTKTPEGLQRMSAKADDMGTETGANWGEGYKQERCYGGRTWMVCRALLCLIMLSIATRCLPLRALLCAAHLVVGIYLRLHAHACLYSTTQIHTGIYIHT